MDLKKIQEILKSKDTTTMMSGIAEALLLLLEEKKSSVTTLNKRPPENGDIITMHCEQCDTEKPHIFQKRIVGNQVAFTEWTCCACKNRIRG